MINRSRRNVMYSMYTPRRGDHGPTDVVSPSSVIVTQAGRWQQALIHCAGCNFLHALPDAENAPLHRRTYHLFSDAALRGAPVPSLGGYFHGLWWTLPLTEQQQDIIQKAHLELLAAVINFCMFCRFVLPDPAVAISKVDIVSHMDGLAAWQVLADHAAKAPAMMHIHEMLLASNEFAQHGHVWQVTHLYGDANFMADAASRGLTRGLHRMAAQLKVTLHQLDVPTDLRGMAQNVMEFLQQQR